MPEHRIALIGFGAIGRQLAAQLSAGKASVPVGAVLVRARANRDVPGPIRIFEAVEEFLVWRPTLTIECAGHEAVRTIVPRLLEAGVPVILASVGALADQNTHEALDVAARTGGSRLTLASGAIGALDALAAASNAAMTDVTYIGSKSPAAWRGTAAEQVCDLASLREPAILFEGNAREAARRFPQNANVAAAVALAGIGFERTKVRLIADPSLTTNRHCVEADGAFGRFQFQIDNAVSPENPKTSWLTALSLEQAVRDHPALKRL